MLGVMLMLSLFVYLLTLSLIMMLSLFVDEMLPKLDIANCCKYVLQLVYDTVFYVGSNC